MTPDERYLQRVAELEDGVLHEIREERIRQQSEEGWTPEHDDSHDLGEMAQAAACYANHSALGDDITIDLDENWLPMPGGWPWSAEWWKPSTPRRDLVKAAALIVAEIERLDRREPTGNRSE